MCVHASIEPLSWESEFFALPTARLNFSASTVLLDAAEFAAFSLVQAKVPADRQDVIDALMSHDFRLVEGEIDLILQLGTFPASTCTRSAENQMADNSFMDELVLSVATEKDIPELRQAAQRVFALSRFRAPWYQPEDSGRFYALWIEKAVLGTFDHQCLVLRDRNGVMQGFVSLRELGNGEARIGLLAAVPDSGRKGIGSALMFAAKQWCLQHNIEKLRVATQTSNLAALRLYIRAGASIASSAYWLYRSKQ